MLCGGCWQTCDSGHCAMLICFFYCHYIENCAVDDDPTMRLVHQQALTRSLTSSSTGHQRYTCTVIVRSMFDLQATDGNARAGTLTTSHGTLQTPGSLLYTRKGSLLNLTPDMVARLGPAAAALQIDPLHLYEALCTHPTDWYIQHSLSVFQHRQPRPCDAAGPRPRCARLCCDRSADGCCSHARSIFLAICGQAQ